MLPAKTSASVVIQKPSFSMAQLILVISLVMSLAGCTNDGAGGPILSSLSTPTDTSAGLGSDQAPDSEAADSDGEEDPTITMTPTPTGVTAHVTWNRPSDFNATGYSIHYGKRSSEEPSSDESASNELSSEEPASCSMGESQTVEAPPVTITGLEPNTPYFFAIRAFNDAESICSSEVTAVTPSAQS